MLLISFVKNRLPYLKSIFKIKILRLSNPWHETACSVCGKEFVNKTTNKVSENKKKMFFHSDFGRSRRGGHKAPHPLQLV